MDCIKAQASVDQFTQGTLPVRVTADYLKHVKECPDCRNDLEISYLLNQSLKNMDTEEIGYDFDRHFSAYVTKRKKKAEIYEVLRVLVILGVSTGLVRLIVLIFFGF